MKVITDAKDGYVDKSFIDQKGDTTVLNWGVATIIDTPFPL